MDKLKEVQKYQFWILLSVALILPLVGWQMAVSGLAKEAEDRSKALDTLNKSITTSPPDPNQEWKKGIEIINGEQSKQKLLAWRSLWERQAPLMVWPEKMPSDPDKITPSQQEYWRTAYRKFVTQVRLKANPYDDDNPNGLIEYPEELLPKPDDEWIQAPSVKQIVASQEDLWLLESLLTAIASVNAGAPSIYDAPIRQIDELYLRGGTAQKGGGGAAKPAAGGTPGTGGGHGGMPVPPAGMLSGGNRDLGIGGGGVTITSANINADDDLGLERAAAADKAAGAAANTGTTGTMGTRGGHGGGGMPMPTSGGFGGGGIGGGIRGGWSGFDKDRYRDDKPEWKTRGFHLEVVMHHRHVPELLTALSNATWPITVLRIQMSDYRDEDLADVGGGTPGGMSGRGMAGGRGGMPGMMPMPGMGAGARSANAPPARMRGGEDAGGDLLNNRSVLDDPNLAHVAIVGLIYIVKKPPEDKTPPTPPPAPGVSPAAPAVAAPGVAPAAAPASETAAVDSTSATTPEAAAPTTDADKSADKPTDEPAGDEGEQPVEESQSPTGSKKEAEADSKKPEPAPSEPDKT
ncbi:MAG TPA: hypothetical protein VGM05_32655 [Planctomycetaceae bacterium]